VARIEGHHTPKPPITPISILEEPEDALLSQERDWQPADRALSAADYLSSDAHREDGNRHREANDGCLPVTEKAYLSLILPL
jgi:hypothetical protein